MTKTATKSPELTSLSEYIQERFDEFSRSQKDVARYIVANPLRAGLVKKLADYPFWNAVWL